MVGDAVAVVEARDDPDARPVGPHDPAVAQDAPAHYGTYGALVGHELTRSVDIKGRVVDAKGEVRTWWTPQDEAAWNERGNKLNTQYSAYDYPNVPGKKVNGALTRDENAADLAGLELAWDALTTAQPTLPVEGKESFFRGWAQLWRQQFTPEVATQNAAERPVEDRPRLVVAQAFGTGHRD